MATGEQAAGVLGVRSALPRGRAVLGGLLVALSAVGLMMAHGAATRTDRRTWLVATADIAQGEEIEAAALGLAPMELADATARRAYGNGDDVVGRVATSAIHAGDLIQRGHVSRDEPDSGPRRRLTVAMSGARALGGDLRPGDRVEVVAANAEGSSVIARAMVSAVTAPRSGLGAGDELSVTLVVDDEATAGTVLAASARDEVALIGTVGSSS